MRALFLRRRASPALVVGPLAPLDLVALAPGADDTVSRDAAARPAPLFDAIARDAPLREALLGALPSPLVERWARVRALVALGLAPALLVAAVDRERGLAGDAPARRALALVALGAGLVLVDLARRAPRHPGATAAVLAMIGARSALLVATGHRAALGGALVATAAAIATLALAPWPAAIGAHLRASLGLARPRPAPAARSRVAYAVLVASLWPLVAFAARAASPTSLAGPLGALVVALVAWAAGRALHARRATGGARASIVVAAALVGALGALASTRAARHFVDAARVALGAAVEAMPRAAGAHPSATALVAAALIAPLCEELVYRGLLQRVLATRLARPFAIAASALAFGLGHVALATPSGWQAVVLGVALGAAYDAGGLGASVGAHALYNAWLALP